MNNLDKDYQTLLQDILDNGVKKEDRTGTGTISVFGRQIRHNMKDGFPLLTTKKMAWKQIVTELLWFLRGDTNIKFLVDNGCHIWDGDAYKRYLTHWTYPIDPTMYELFGPDTHMGCFHEDKRLFTKEEFINKIKTDDEFANTWGELGPIYGKQWRNWAGNGSPLTKDYEGNISSYLIKPIDQIENLISELKTNPDSRRLMVSAWNVGELDKMTLPPCHYGFQVYTRELSRFERCDWLKTYKPELEEECIRQDGRSSWLVNKNLHTEWLDKQNTPTRAISLMWNQRSVDTFLGLPFNIASYGLLLEIIAKEVNMVPDQLIGNLGDVHLYSNHIEQAKEQIGRDLTLEERRAMVTQEQFDKVYTGGSPDSLSHSEINQFGVPKRTREPYPLPTVTLPSCLQPGSGNWDKLVFEDFYLNDYQSHPTIKAPLSN